MADVEIRFLGDEDDAERSIRDLERSLEILEGIVERVEAALGNMEFKPGQVPKFITDAALMVRALQAVEDQAHDTQRALALGPSTLLSAAVTGRVLLGDRGPAFPLPQGGAPGVGMVPYVPPAAFYQNRVFAMPGQYAQRGDDGVWRVAAASQIKAAHDLDDAATLLMGAAAAGGGSGGGGGGGFGLGALLGAAGFHGFGGGGGTRSLMNMPGWAGYFGRMFGGILPIARFGSLAGLAGFGAERFLGTGLGILGSMGGGLLGAGTAAAGILGTTAVGMGTDMAGIGQAAGDIKTVSGDLNNLNTAIAQYGKNSRQAAAAQAQLNLDLKGFSPVARAAVLNTAQISQHFKQMFDYFTGPAERVGAQIIGQGMQTGQAFLPTIGRFAFGNMNIIQQGLQPMFAWLKQTRTASGEMGGLGIFTDLEQIFQKRLPVAVHAGTQAFEVFMHFIDDAAHRTGGFMNSIDKFFTKLNTPAGLQQMDHTVGTLIGLFHSWADVLLGVGHIIFDLFRPAVGLGKDFADQLTRLINLTRHWLEASSTQDVLHQLFEAHKQQLNAIFAIIRALSPILFHAISAFAQIETVVTKLTVGPLKMLANLISSITRHPLADKIFGWAAALYYVNRALGSTYDMLAKLIARWIAAGTAATASAAETDAALASEDASLATTTTATGVLGKAVAALGGEALLGRLAALRLAFVGLLGPILAAAAAVYGLDKLIAKLTGFDAIKKAWGSAGWGADNTAGDTFKGKDPYPVGTSDYFEWMAGYLGIKSGQHNVPGAGHGNVDTHNKAYKQGAAAAHSKKKKKTAPDGTSVDWHQFVGHHAGEDCSLFTQRVYREVWGISIPRTSEEQFHGGMPATGVDVGDLLFYNGHNSFKPPGHVALYIGNGNVIQDNGSGTVQIMPASALDSLGYMGARTFLKKNAISTSGTAGYPGYNPGGAGMHVGSTRVPGASTGASTQSTRQAVLAQGLGELRMIRQALGDLGNLPAGWRQRFSPELHKWQAEIEKLDHELRDKGLSQKTVDNIRSRIDLITKHVQEAMRKIKIAIEAFNDLTMGKGLLKQITLALTGNLFQLGVDSKPMNPMNVDTLDKAHAKWDQKLKQWQKEIEKLDKELKDKTISQATVDAITRRMQQLQANIAKALAGIKSAAQTQLQAAQDAWSAFIQQFDSTLPGAPSAQDQLDAARAQLAKDKLAVALDTAQSAILGGNTDPNLAQQILNDMTAALMPTLGVMVTSTGIPYTQQQLDNWLQLWGAYYASLGYTPQQMFDAFNKLLASVGLPPIDNPYSTGGLPLPPGMGGSTGSSIDGGGGVPPSHVGGGPGPPGPPVALFGRVGGPKPTVRLTTGAHRSSFIYPTGGAHAVAAAHAPHVEITLANGMEWLDQHLTVKVNGVLARQGRKANARARSGRH